MKCIDELKKIGIDKISAKTRITQEKVQDIIDFKFDAFNKTRALGFTQIITRDFGVDLSEWFDAYNEHCNANTEQTEETSNSVDEVASSINIPIESDKKDKSYIVLIALLIVLVVLFMGFFVYNNFISTNDLPSTKNANQSKMTPFQEIQRQSEAQTSADLTQTTSTTEAQNNAQESRANQSDIDLAQNNANPDNANVTNPNSAIVANQTPANPSESQTAATSAPISTTAPISNNVATQIEELTIMPNEPLWVGVIDLKTRRKKQISIDSQYSLPLDGDKIIRTGHSYFSISSGTNFAKQYIGGDNKYFLYRVDGGLREISKAEFLELNKGEEW